ncbi:hypothetical protein [uncultured Jatrophihabitans sp.]|uniref:hypothetical protein n=1 Tax=uncultured Jatrophihabitans sp. TaxID=1610747 RepID=UPI0035CBBF58
MADELVDSDASGTDPIVLCGWIAEHRSELCGRHANELDRHFRMRPPFAQLTLFPRAVAIGALSAGAAGGIVGLVIGLFTYPPTAPFAVFELGFPATIVGAVCGLVIGSILVAIRRSGRPRRP